MRRTILADAFAHHVWATLRLIDACQALTEAELSTTVPGTYGSIIDTLRHLVGADRSYLGLLSQGAVTGIDEEGMDLAELRGVMEADGAVWQTVIAGEFDPDIDVVRQRDDGTQSHAPLGIRLAQVVHHETDHRSQVCTALTTIGLTPPAVDVWDFAESQGRLVEVPATTG